jgi:hypothetical protein
MSVKRIQRKGYYLSCTICLVLFIMNLTYLLWTHLFWDLTHLSLYYYMIL